jgi:RimJ/RimL family protein N-acetyltransferase
LTLRREHFQELHTIYSNPSTMKNWHTLTHTKFSETEKILNEYMDTNSSWVLELKENKKVIGLINCFTVESNKSTGMGYIISSDYQKRGLAYEASQIIIQHLFKKWNLPFIELWIYEDNLPSIGLAQKLGFTLENSFERLGADGISMKKTGIYWLRQCDWWMNKLKG